ncbi:hypothetical protein EXIGLDRAFT_719898 [Exidia glandulosa HHB12029]|uniref:Uncharacterized protein n=1 Tax=Exidia glandulosa HHB12029 TaxID=1314781 RepID=A0A166ADJ6_EXIGL|nr:hypothetical protein EXIGLDRAFT_719898 [Exidia glandulosa HHB12029]
MTHNTRFEQEWVDADDVQAWGAQNARASSASAPAGSLAGFSTAKVHVPQHVLAVGSGYSAHARAGVQVPSSTFQPVQAYQSHPGIARQDWSSTPAASSSRAGSAKPSSSSSKTSNVPAKPAVVTKKTATGKTAGKATATLDSFFKRQKSDVQDSPTSSALSNFPSASTRLPHAVPLPSSGNPRLPVLEEPSRPPLTTSNHPPILPAKPASQGPRQSGSVRPLGVTPTATSVAPMSKTIAPPPKPQAVADPTSSSTRSAEASRKRLGMGRAAGYVNKKFKTHHVVD